MAPGARSARTSLMSPAPAAAAARITSGLLVSTEMTTALAPRSRSITGSTRRSSSSALTASAPGRVDSPPTSMMAAPSAAMRRPCATAASAEQKRPPSENESGVTLSTPMTSGVRRSSVLSAQRRCTGGASGDMVRRTPFIGRRTRRAAWTVSAVPQESADRPPGPGAPAGACWTASRPSPSAAWARCRP